MEHSHDPRLKALEDRVAALEQAVFSEDRVVAPVYHAPVHHVSSVHDEPDGLTLAFQWLAKDWLMKLGAVLLLLAMGWFVRYSFIQNWIGPSMRIFLGLLAGLILFAVGNMVIFTRRIPGQVLVATGVTMQFVAMFAARNVYDFFTPVSALITMAVIVICLAGSAVFHNSRALAILAYVGGLLAPVLVNAPREDTVGLLRYIFLLDVGVLVLVALRSWRSLLVFSLIGTFFYSMSFSDIAPSAAWIFMGLFYALFVFSHVYISLKTLVVNFSDVFIASLNALIFLFWVSEFIPADWQGFVMTAAGLVSLLVAVIFSYQEKAGHAVTRLYAILAAFSFVSATIFQLDGQALVMALGLESIALVVLSAFALRSTSTTEIVSPFYLLPFVFALAEDSFSREVWMAGPLFGEHFFVVLSVAIAAFASALVLRYIASPRYELMMAHTIMASLFSLSFVWLFLHSMIEVESVARGTALVIFSLIGVGLFFYGVRSELKVYRLFGSFLLGGVVLRLLFVEVWQMPLLGRVVTFLLIGLLLLATAFFERRSKTGT